MIRQTRREQPFVCPCTGQKTLACECAPMVKEHHAVRARVRFAKRALGVVAGILLAIVLIGLSGCASASYGPSKAAPARDYVQSQRNAEQWDIQLVDQCTDLAITMVVEAYLNAPDPKPSDELVKAALNEVFSGCMFTYGRAI